MRLKKNHFSPRGLSLILPVLILGVAGISIFLFLASTTAVSLSEIFSRQEAVAAREDLFGCLDEYLVHLSAEPDFSPTSLSLLGSSCSVSITEPISGQKQIVLTITGSSVTRQLTAVVQLSPLTLISVSEP